MIGYTLKFCWVICLMIAGLGLSSCGEAQNVPLSEKERLQEEAMTDSLSQAYSFVEYENGKKIINLDKVSFLSDNPLPLWFPLLIGGIFLLIVGGMYYTRHQRDVGVSRRNVILGILLILFYLSEVMFFLFENEGGSIAYYMESATVGWIWAILGVFLTIIICFVQWIISGMYLLSIHRVHLSFYSFIASNVVCTLSLFLYTLGVAKEFFSKYLLLIVLVVSVIHIIVMIVNNIKEGNCRMLLLEIPLYLVGLPATMLSFIMFFMAVSIVLAAIFVKNVYKWMTGGTFDPTSSSDRKFSMSGLAKSCKNCSHYSHSDGRCMFGNGYGEPYTDCWGCSEYKD